MLEFKLTLISKAETLLGIMIDQGEYEYNDRWIPFIRIRLGLIFLTLDFTKYHISK